MLVAVGLAAVVALSQSGVLPAPSVTFMGADYEYGPPATPHDNESRGGDGKNSESADADLFAAIEARYDESMPFTDV